MAKKREEKKEEVTNVIPYEKKLKKAKKQKPKVADIDSALRKTARSK